jgi:hypothetical protein
MTDAPRRPPDVPPPPTLPDVDSPPPEDVLDGVLSKDDIVEDATPVDEIVGERSSGADAPGRGERPR